MDFLTRLAQRTTGELRAVQPRLPARFEPVAGVAQPAAAPADEISFSAAEPAVSLPVAAPSPRFVTTHSVPERRDVATRSEPIPAPINVIEATRPAVAPAMSASRDSIDPPVAVAPEPERRPPPEAPTAPRRTSIEIRPATISIVQPPAPIGSRRGAVTPTGDLGKQPLSARASEGGATPATVHVHIGRVDVRAVMPPAAPPKPAARPAAPRPTLEDYLAGRKGGSQP